MYTWSVGRLRGIPSLLNPADFWLLLNSGETHPGTGHRGQNAHNIRDALNQGRTMKQCQSCGMPLSKDPGGGGTERDGTQE